MKTSLFKFAENNWNEHVSSQQAAPHAMQLVLCFGPKSILKERTLYGNLKNKFPKAEIALCSTAGEIYNDSVQEIQWLQLGWNLKIQKSKQQQ